MTTTRSIVIETQFFNTMRLIDYNPLDEARSYMTRTISRERRLY